MAAIKSLHLEEHARHLAANLLASPIVTKSQYGTEKLPNPFTQPPTKVTSPKNQIHYHPNQQSSTSQGHDVPAALSSNPSPSSPKTIISEQYKQFLASRLPGNPVAPNPNPGLTLPPGMSYYPTSSVQKPQLDPRLRQYPQNSVNPQQTVLDPRQIYQQQLAQRALNDPRFLGHQETHAATNKGPQIPVLHSQGHSSNDSQTGQSSTDPEPVPNASRLVEQIRNMPGGVVPNQSNLQAIQEAMTRLSLKSLPIGTNPDTKTPTNHGDAPQQQTNGSQTANNQFQNIPTPIGAPENKLPNQFQTQQRPKQQTNSLNLIQNQQQQPQQQQQQPSSVRYPQISGTQVYINHQDTHKSIYPPGSKNAEWAAYIQQNPGTTHQSEAIKRQQQTRRQDHQNTQPYQATRHQQPRTLPAEVRQQIRQQPTERKTAQPTATNTVSQTNSRNMASLANVRNSAGQNVQPNAGNTASVVNVRNTAGQNVQSSAGNTASLVNVRKTAGQNVQPSARNTASLVNVRNTAGQNVQPNTINTAYPTNRQNVSEIPGINTRPQLVKQPPKTTGLLQNEAARVLPVGAAPYDGGGGGGNDMLMTMMMMNQMQGGEAMPMAKLVEMMNPKPKPVLPIQLATPAPKTLKEALGYYDPVMREFIPRGAMYGPEIIPKPTTPPPVMRPQMTPQQQLQAQVQLMAKLRQNPQFAKMQTQMKAKNPLLGKPQNPPQLGLQAEKQMMARLMAQQNPQTGRPTPTYSNISRELRQQPVTSRALPSRSRKSVDIVGKARLKAFEHIKRLPRDELLKEYYVWRIENGLETSKKRLRQFLKFLKGKIYTVAPLFVPQQPIM